MGQAEALSDALGDLGVTEATVVGHDFGGPVALSLTAYRPDLIIGLGLLATNTFRDTPIPIPLSLVTWPVVGRVMAPALFSRASLAMMLGTGTGHYLPDERPEQVAAGVLALLDTSLASAR